MGTPRDAVDEAAGGVVSIEAFPVFPLEETMDEATFGVVSVVVLSVEELTTRLTFKLAVIGCFVAFGWLMWREKYRQSLTLCLRIKFS